MLNIYPQAPSYQEKFAGFSPFVSWESPSKPATEGPDGPNHPRYAKERFGAADLLVYSRISQESENFYRNFKGFEVYPASLKVLKNFTRPGQSGGLRSEISSFSDCAKKRLRFRILNSAYDFKSQYCLTYHENVPKNGRDVKKQLNTFLQYVRDNFDAKYLWILEFQTSRKAPHFHVFFTVEPNPLMRRKLAIAWNRITKESKQHLKFHKNRKNFIPWEMKRGGYLTKYLDKSNQKLVPEHFLSVGRFWGSSRGLVTDAINYSTKIIGNCIREGGFFHSDLCSQGSDPQTGIPYAEWHNLKFVYRCLRKHHEKTVRNIRGKLGLRGRAFKSSIMRPTSALLINSSKIFLQIHNYLEVQHGQRIPF